MQVVDEVGFDEWQEVADKCKYATFFHTPTWSMIFAETYPEMEIATKKFIFDDARKAILPLIKIKAAKGLSGSYISNVAGVYGGVISEQEITQEEISQVFNSLINKQIRTISITGAPFFDYTLPSKFKMKEDFTQIIKLGKNEREIEVGFEYSARKQINKAKRAGVICREAKDFAEWEEYYSIYQEAIKKWGKKATSHYPLSLFKNIFKARTQNMPKIKLWLVILEDKIVGGNLNFYHNSHCVEWHACFLSDFFKYGIRNFLVHRIICDANRSGYKYYDFNPSGGHQGTVRFKESFGPENVKIKRWRWEKPLVKTITIVKRKIASGLRLCGYHNEKLS